MSYIALYRKWRPLLFEDVVEQDYVVKTLKNSIKSARVAHAYLFCGSRGTGKTSIAKIFSRAINCLTPNDGNPCNQCVICKGVLSGRNLDVIEIDAASNNGVDNVREIRDEVVYTPTESKFKVYIIDEVHMLSSGAFNALLKTLEEPPSHVVFILATTEPHKLPSTILSRCQRFDFKRISLDGIAQRIHKIANDGGVNLHADAAKLVAKLAEGGLRDAISILDQCISAGNKELNVSEVMSVVGLVSHALIQDMAKAILTKNTSEIFNLSAELVNSGKDVKHFVSEMVFYFRDILILKVTKDVTSLSYPLYDDMEGFTVMANQLPEDFLMSLIKDLSLLENTLRWARNPRIALEIALIKLCERKFSDPTDELRSRITELEQKIASGNFRSNNDSVSSTTTPEFSNTLENSKNIANKSKSSSSEQSVKSSSKASSTTPSGGIVPYWNDVLQAAKSMGRMTIYTNLLNSTACFSGENAILVNPSSDFDRISLLKDDNLNVIQNIVKKLKNLDISIKITSDGIIPVMTSEDMAIQKAKNIAKIGNIPLNIIDD